MADYPILRKELPKYDCPRDYGYTNDVVGEAHQKNAILVQLLNMICANRFHRSIMTRARSALVHAMLTELSYFID